MLSMHVLGSGSAVVPLAAMLLLSACSSGDGDGRRQQTVWVKDGEPVNCISRSQVRSIRIIDDRTIDFEMTGRRAYRNELPFPCFGLSFNSAIRLNSRTSQLCRVDSFTIRSLGGGWGGSTCQLGQFQPMVRKPVPEPEPRDQPG
jgi:hypothetical protein